MLKVNDILTAHVPCGFSTVEDVNSHYKSSILGIPVKYLYNTSNLKSNVSGVNFCKNFNKNYCTDITFNFFCSTICKLISLSTSHKLNYVNNSLKTYSWDTTRNADLPVLSSIIVKMKSPLIKPAAQNLLVQLIEGLKSPFHKEMNNDINNPPSEISITDDEMAPPERDFISSGSSNEHNIHLSHGCLPWKQRQRTVSEHSDDICFLEEDGSNNQNYDFYYDDGDESEDENSDEDIKGSFEKNENKLNGSLESITSDNSSCYIRNVASPIHKVKKVRFNLNPVVHTMYAWSFAYKSARKGQWENFARDRDRFRRRIENTSKYLNPILTPEHRSFIYNSRFGEKDSDKFK
uniref:Protein DP71L n=1 Tax=Ceratitis capitata TaxID=7213 RepID=W8BX39_CERCA